MTIQQHEFANGDKVFHRVKLANSTSKFSVWVDNQGNITGASRIDKLNRDYSVSNNQKELLKKAIKHLI